MEVQGLLGVVYVVLGCSLSERAGRDAAIDDIVPAGLLKSSCLTLLKVVWLLYLGHIMQSHYLVVLAVVAGVAFVITGACRALAVLERAAVPADFLHEILVELTFKHRCTS
mmetsp:Transcript_15362/g.20825  ORF Transcript_15362/g.20825 Transcript_15362/m.20825 type:complete len:111 (-) Transcript_15362:332-664(-)